MACRMPAEPKNLKAVLPTPWALTPIDGPSPPPAAALNSQVFLGDVMAGLTSLRLRQSQAGMFGDGIQGLKVDSRWSIVLSALPFPAMFG